MSKFATVFATAKTETLDKEGKMIVAKNGAIMFNIVAHLAVGRVHTRGYVQPQDLDFARKGEIIEVGIFRDSVPPHFLPKQEEKEATPAEAEVLPEDLDL